jgi:hypothetical protein
MSFQVCRVCLESDNLLSLLKGNGKKLEMFHEISEIDVRLDSLFNCHHQQEFHHFSFFLDQERCQKQDRCAHMFVVFEKT